MPNTNTPINPFKKGNQYHKLATHTGRPKRYTTPEDLWEAGNAYFTWCATTPVVIHRPRRGKLVPVFKNREMSLKHLHEWLGVCNLYHYRTLPAFTYTVYRIYNIVAWYNFVHGAAGLIKGRSVGHTLRKKTNSYPANHPDRRIIQNKEEKEKPAVDTRKVRIITQINKIPQNKEENEKTRIDTRKVRIRKQKLFSTPMPLTKEKRYTHSSSPLKRYSAKIRKLKKHPVDARKVRIPPKLTPTSRGNLCAPCAPLCAFVLNHPHHNY